MVSERRPVEQHGDEHDAHYDPGADSGHGRAGQQQIEQGCGERRGRGPFADRVTQRDRRMSASPALISQNTVPAMMTICRPEMDRMWNRPESRMA
jgi:hypothetical protein